jgi:tetratricopeptide (TPR) repeat protein
MKRQIVLLLFSVTIIIFPQQFKTGVYTALPPTSASWENLQQIKAMGPNTVINHTNQSNKTGLENLFDSVIVYNAHDATHYIHHYTAGYYSKWEAEENLTINAKTTGIKHQFGSVEGNAWRSGTDPNDINKLLVTGPDYIQDREYRLWYWSPATQPLNYILKFRMKIDGDITSDDEVCEISVEYRTEGGEYGTIMSPVTLRANNLSNTFTDHTFSYTIPETINGSATQSPERGISGMYPTISNPDETQIEEAYGVQFNIKWLGSRDLYVDYIEVYDQRIWGNEFLSYPDTARSRILNYADAAVTSNTMYFYGLDEPWTLDNYTPYIVVDSILTNNGKPPLFTLLHPNYNHLRNHEHILKRFIETVQPKKVFYNVYPYFIGETYTDPVCLEMQRDFMQIPFNEGFAVDDYYFAVQAFGYSPPCSLNTLNLSRKPNPAQLRATTMLALAHGAKGLFYWNYYSYASDSSKCSTLQYIDGIIDTNLQPTDLYYELKDNIFYRLNNSLGNTLRKLNYNSNYLQLKYFNPTETFEAVTNDYLTLGYNQSNSDDCNWHAGFFSDKTSLYNKYFLLANILTTHSRTTKIKITPPTQQYVNFKFKDVESGASVSFTSQHVQNITLPAGEGKLFQIAPVVLYGGNLITDEAITGTNTLHEAMTIKPGAKLTVNGTYNIYGDITVEAGAQLDIKPGAKLNFFNNSRLIVNSNFYAVGAPGNKIEFNFNGSTSDECIKISNAAQVIINLVSIKNGKNGLIINNISEYARVRNTSFENLEAAAAVANSPQLIFQYNDALNTEMGLFTSNVADAHIISNTFVTTRQIVLPGIFFNSSSGNIRRNTIVGYSSGILTGNASPLIGDNTIYLNSEHGLYVGAGSLPDLRAALVRVPCANVFEYYPISGYNKIHSNGGNYFGPFDDGSEIFIYNSDILLDEGCNSIYDDRLVGDPPYTVKNLICGSTEREINIHAAYNHWGDNQQYLLTDRFCNFTVQYEPYHVEPCLLPQDNLDCPLFMIAADGTRIDTLYPSASPSGEIEIVRELLAEANAHYYAADYETAQAEYAEIILYYPDIKESFEAYAKLLSIERLTSMTPAGFTAMSEYYESKLNSISDSLLRRMVIHLTNLALINEYLIEEAIAEFEKIIDLHSGSEEAILAEINIYTAQLIIENWSGLAKSKSFSLNNFSDVTKRLKEKFGGKSNLAAAIEIPKEYTLFQNYPNPFNPVTKIKYALPMDGLVTIKIYDILGKEVAQLVNDYKTAGTYETLFDASKLASGIYFYRLVSRDYTAIKKMMLIK